MSPYFTRQIEPGAMVFLGDVEGEFRLPDPLPEQGRCSSAPAAASRRSGHVRELERRGALDDVIHIHCAREPDQVIFGDDLRRMNAEYDGYTLVEHLTGKVPRLTPDEPRRDLPGLARARDVPVRAARPDGRARGALGGRGRSATG